MSLRVVLFYKHLLDAGGAERLVLRELEHLRRFGHDARLLTYRAEPPALFGREPEPERELVVTGRGGDVIAFARTAAWLRRFRPDWIVSSSGHIEAWALARLAGTPYALHVHHPLFLSLSDRDKFARRYRHAFEALCEGNRLAPRFRETERGLTRADRIRLEARAALHHRAVVGAKHVLVLSEHAREEKRLLYGVHARVLRGALDAPEPGVADRAAARRALGLGPADPLVFTVARLMEAKRIDVLIRAFAGLLRERPGARLAIGGSGPDEQRLRQAARAHGADAAVDFRGRIPEAELPLWYRAADVFASLEGADFNLTPFEALAAGTPVLVSVESDLGAELPRTGWTEAVEPEPAPALAGLRRLLERSERLDRASLAPALRGFTWEAYFRGVEALLLERGGPPGSAPDPRGRSRSPAALSG